MYLSFEIVYFNGSSRGITGIYCAFCQCELRDGGTVMKFIVDISKKKFIKAQLNVFSRKSPL